MDNIVYNKMKKQFQQLYIETIKPCLIQYEKERKEETPKTFVAYILLASFVFIMLSALLSFWGQVFKMIFIIFMIVFFVSGILLVILTSGDPVDSEGKKSIKFFLEKDLKRKLMTSFLSIFSKDATWDCGLFEDYFKKLDEYRKLNIFNPFLSLYFDDRICLSYKNININIFETNTSIFNLYSLANIFLLLVPICFFSPIFYLFVETLYRAFPKIAVFLGILLLPFILFLMKKGIQYAPFKGIVVEFNLNKNFEGHTFFLDKSFTSKKIEINGKKYGNVKLESIDFMNKYNVYTTNQIEARYLLTASMIYRLERLQVAFDSNYIRGTFKNDKFILAIETGKDMFAMGNDFKKSDYLTFKKLFKEIVAIMEIVDQLELDSETGL